MMSDKVGTPKPLDATTEVEDTDEAGRKIKCVTSVKEGGAIEVKSVWVDTGFIGLATFEISDDGKTMKNTTTSRNGISFTTTCVPAEAPTGWFS